MVAIPSDEERQEIRAARLKGPPRVHGTLVGNADDQPPCHVERSEAESRHRVANEHSLRPGPDFSISACPWQSSSRNDKRGHRLAESTYKHAVYLPATGRWISVCLSGPSRSQCGYEYEAWRHMLENLEKATLS